MTIYIVIINLLALVGLVAITVFIEGLLKERKDKREEQFKRDVLDIIKEYEEKTNAQV